MWLYVADLAVKLVLEWDNEVNYMSTNRNAIFPEDSEEDFSFSYTWADQHWTAPASWELTIECRWAWSNNAAWWYAKWKIAVRKGQKFSIMVWWRWNRSDNWTTYWFGWSTTYGWRWWWGLSWVFTWETAIWATDASRVVIIAWWAWGWRTWGWAWWGTNWQNWNGGSYWYPWAWGTQTWRWSWGNTRSEQFRWWGWSWTYWFGWGWWWRWGNGSGWDGSWDDDAQAGWGSGHCCSEMTETTLTVGWWAAANVDWTISFHFESKVIVPVPTYVTQAWIYHNPDLGLISMSSDWENWVTIADKNVWATSSDPTDQNSYWKTFQYGNIYWFPWEGDSTAITTSSAIPSLSGYEWGNLYSDSTYRTNMSWLGRNTNLWKGIAFTNLKSLEKWPCPLWFHVPTVSEFNSIVAILQSIIWEEEEITLETLETYFLMSHPKVRKWSWSFSTDYIDSIYWTLDVELDHDIHLFWGMSLSPWLSSWGTILWFLWFRIHQYSESSALSIEMWAGLANTSMYIRPFRDKAMIPTTEWTRLSPWWERPRLPLAYQEVAYIEGTGTQYLDTGVSAPNWFKTELRVLITGQVAQTLIGSHNVGTPYWRNNVNTFTVWSTWGLHMNEEMINSLWSINLWQIYEIEGCTILWASYLTVDWVRLTTGTNTSPMSSNNILLLQNQYWLNHGDSCNKARIYSCKMYNDSLVLIRDFVPCYRRIDWVIWMYDLVNNQFYTNAGSWTFAKWVDVRVPSVPQQYQEVEYIQGTWTQYIDTGLTLETAARLDNFAIRVKATHTWSWNFAGTKSAVDSPTYMTMEVVGWATTTLRCFIANGSTYTDRAVLRDNNITIDDILFSYSSSVATQVINWTTYTQARSSWYTTSDRPIYIFARNQWANTAEQLLSMKLYTCLMAVNWTLERYLVPCYRISDSKPWLYDLVNDVFYVNSWTGEFTRWNAIRFYRTNSNTISYFPFENWFNDVTWNRTLSVSGVTIDNQTAKFSAESNNMALSSVINNSVLTISVMYYYWWYATWWWWNTLFAHQWGTYHHILMPATSSSWTLWNIWFYNSWWKPSSKVLALNKWYHIVTTKNWTNQKIYVNWELVQNETSFNNGTSWCELWMIWNYNTNQNQWPIWNMSECIFESREWTQDDVLQYLDKVKDFYWIEV